MSDRENYGSVVEGKLLVTFALFTYNQEKYIREAVEGVFAQTYSPMEIILSDDCSTDGTFAILEELVKNYNGKNKIILNRNNKNLGIGNHVNHVMSLSSGEYVVMAAGDDISLPERTEKVLHLVGESQGVMAIFSDCIEMDENSIDKKVVSASPPENSTDPLEMCRHLFRGITGATSVWHRNVFDVFGPMRGDAVFEDRIFTFRAALLGKICYLEEPLVRYRRHSENTVGMFDEITTAAMAKRMNCYRVVYLNNMKDTENTSDEIIFGRHYLKKCQAIMKRELRKIDGYLLFLSELSYLDRVKGLVKIVLNGGNPWYVMKNFHGFRR